jgi:hypothetical protein
VSPVEVAELTASAGPSDHTRYYGLYAGTVTDNDDPDAKCRIQASVPEVLAAGNTGWCVPALPYTGDGAGFAAVPPIGTQVWVQWPGGDLSAPPIWSGGSYSGGGAVQGAGPNTVILLTPGGHRVELDDDGTALTITCSQGPVITLDSSGVSIDNGQGAKIVMQGPKVDVNDGALVVQ